ncbi:hypothetical protein RHMOL_Rhmol10G0137900 [Rhododendron molle]|uniref:Uncharacterized protein n=1 Tax=Rhododendron molle TaxID=49168 RepID=A0ACC0M2Z3_RHOML|nr:hypothetical protein RHMOL_Rhmol10G0137900 [Rhododendron molle]
MHISNPVISVWRRPEQGVIKINVDAAISKATNAVGTGVIARDSVGLIVGIFVKSYEGLNSHWLA